LHQIAESLAEIGKGFLRNLLVPFVDGLEVFHEQLLSSRERFDIFAVAVVVQAVKIEVVADFFKEAIGLFGHGGSLRYSLFACFNWCDSHNTLLKKEFLRTSY
jgi:hypothetical protein